KQVTVTPSYPASSTSSIKYGGVNKIETVTVSELNTYVVNSKPQFLLRYVRSLLFLKLNGHELLLCLNIDGVKEDTEWMSKVSLKKGKGYG
ncbi:unnamed protein product, partial [Brassica napus]